VTPTRVVHCQEAVAWLQAQDVMRGCSVFTSMPDWSEMPPLTVPQWKEWTIRTAQLIFTKLPDDGIAIFYQTDIKVNRLWVDKAFLILKGAEESNIPLLWHKIVCRHPAGTSTPGRPGYSHIIAFSRTVVPDLSKSTPDVLPALGGMTWSRAMGLNAARMAVQFIRTHAPGHAVVDPFCGVGTALAAANEAGLNAIGVELSRKRAQKARNLHLATWEAAQSEDDDADSDGG